jgi:hypothetical protein
LSVDGYDYSFASDDGVGLIKTPVLSNTTGLIYAEEMCDLGGSFEVNLDNANNKLTINNLSAIGLRDVGVIGVGDDDRLVRCWVGDLEPDQQTDCELKRYRSNDKWHDRWQQNPTLARPDLTLDDGTDWTSSKLQNELYLGKMLEVITDQYPLTRGEFIAVGWTEENLSKLTISPQTNQNKHRTLILIQLKTANLEPVKPDEIIFPVPKAELAE